MENSGNGEERVIFGAATMGWAITACRTTTRVPARSLLTSFLGFVPCATLLLPMRLTLYVVSCSTLSLFRCFSQISVLASCRGVWGVVLRVAQDESKLQALLDQAKGKPGLKLTRKKLKKAIQHLVRACYAARAPSSKVHDGGCSTQRCDCLAIPRGAIGTFSFFFFF